MTEILISLFSLFFSRCRKYQIILLIDKMQAQQEVVEEQALQEEIVQDNTHSPPNPIMALEHDGIKVGVSFY